MPLLKNEFSWSFSRHKLFNECRRAYYYYYYESWGGWDRNAPDRAQKTYLLKKMQNLAMWAGSIVHELLAGIIQNRILKKHVSYSESIENATRILQQQWEASHRKLWLKNPRAHLNLFEHYYQKDISQEDIDLKVKRKVYEGIRNFYASGFLAYIDTLAANPRDHFLSLEEIDSFLFEGTKLYVVPDFAIRDEGIRLYDWKTGRPNRDDTLQLSCYALYAQSKWQAQPHEIRIFPVYLLEEKITLNPIETIDADTVRTFLRHSIKEMRSVLEERSDNEIIPAQCAKTEITARCARCFFQEICE